MLTLAACLVGAAHARWHGHTRGSGMKRWQVWAVAAVAMVGLATAAWIWTRQTPAVPGAAKHTPLAGARIVDSTHYRVTTTASHAQALAVAHAMEALRGAYLSTMDVRPQVGGRLSLVLYKDRAEFKANNRSRPWAEAYYLAPHCNAYVADGRNPYHWMVHEGVHQLNNEVAHYRLPGWINEGLASYFGTSRIVDGVMRPGEIDRDAYPIWWLPDLWLSGDRERDIDEGTVLSLRTLMRSDRDDVNRRFNRYYIGYWSLSHFLFHYRGGRYADGYRKLVRLGGTTTDFERLIGPIDRIEAEWYGYLSDQVAATRTSRVDTVDVIERGR